MALFAIGINAKTHSVEEREQFALLEQQIVNKNRQLIDDEIVSEIVTLSTCNRIEHYFITDQPIDKVITEIFPDPTPKNLTILSETRVSHHLFEVASGVDSQVLGENEVLGQVKKSYQLSQENGLAGKHLNVLFQKAIYVGKRVRTVTDISRCSVSTGGIILDKIKLHFKELNKINVLLIGTGDISRSVCTSLYKKGVRNIFLTNRNREKGELIAHELEAGYIPINELYDKVKESEVIISSTTAPHYLITKAHEKYLTHGKKLLIDLAVPRDIEPDVADIENIELINIDSIKTMTDKNKGKREKEIDKTHQIISLENCNYCSNRLLRDESNKPGTLNFFDFNKLYKSHKAHT